MPPNSTYLYNWGEHGLIVPLMWPFAWLINLKIPSSVQLTEFSYIFERDQSNLSFLSSLPARWLSSASSDCVGKENIHKYLLVFCKEVVGVRAIAVVAKWLPLKFRRRMTWFQPELSVDEEQTQESVNCKLVTIFGVLHKVIALHEEGFRVFLNEEDPQCQLPPVDSSFHFYLHKTVMSISVFLMSLFKNHFLLTLIVFNQKDWMQDKEHFHKMYRNPLLSPPRWPPRDTGEGVSM